MSEGISCFCSLLIFVQLQVGLTAFAAAVFERHDKLRIMANTKVILQSVITCPNCGYKKEETMPTDACQYFYVCKGCDERFKPKDGDCCVYCSYGTVKCPPIQGGACKLVRKKDKF